MSATPGSSVLFAPNAGSGIGGGHVLRCLSLATALARGGAEIAVSAPHPAPYLVDCFAETAVEVSLAPDFETVLRDAEARRPDAVVLDHYGWGAAEEARVAPFTRCVMALDDLANRRHACDLLLDPGYGRVADDYAGRVSSGARLLLGPEFALLRPAFNENRVRNRRLRRRGHLPGFRSELVRVFVSFGLSDVGGVAARATDLIRRLAPDVQIDVALAADAPSRPVLADCATRDPRLIVHVDERDVARLIAQADLAIGAGGSATWERFCLEVATLAVVVAENQRALIHALDDDGYLLGCNLSSPSFEADFSRCFEYLRDPILRAHLSRRAGSLCDGRGAERAAAALFSVLDRQG